MAVRERKALRERIRAEAEADLARGVGAVEFSGAFFGPQGRLRQLWDTDEERQAVVASDLYRWLQQRLAELRTAEADALDREVERLSGRLTVTVPRSLHAALKSEAAGEGVSLSELIRLKLSVPYRDTVRRLASGG